MYDLIHNFVTKNPNQPLPKNLLEALDQVVVRADVAGVELSPWLQSTVDQVLRDYRHDAHRRPVSI